MFTTANWFFYYLIYYIKVWSIITYTVHDMSDISTRHNLMSRGKEKRL